MKTVCDTSQCAGCMACVDICPKEAIKICDGISSYDAVIDENKCVRCNSCHRICPQNNPAQMAVSIKWYQGWAEDNDVRRSSSSGGAAYAIEKVFIENGGIVCSCVFKNGNFIFEFAEYVEELFKFQGSKYVKSNPSGIYIKIKKHLEDGRKVLFVGLPCQVSAVRNYTGKKLSLNLYTVDLICHGTPSPKLLDRFLAQYKHSLADFTSMTFRNKAKFQIIGNSRGIITEGVSDRYSIAFLNSLIYTENCYSCAYANQKRVSDVTLGDSWGNELPIESQKQGVSLILCQTQKGRELVNSAAVVLKDVDLQNAINHNHQLQEPSKRSPKREVFFKGINDGERFNSLVLRCLPKPSIKQSIKDVLIRMHIL